MMYPQHEWKLARYWRDVSEGKVMEEEQIGILFWRVALEHKKLKKSPWKEHTGQLGEIPNSELVSLSVSLHAYYLSDPSDKLDGHPGTKPRRNVVQGHIGRKRETLNFLSLYPLNNDTKTGQIIEYRSVLEYAQFEHTTR
jgi:hypothetical protein